MSPSDFPELGDMSALAAFLGMRTRSGARRLALRHLATVKFGRKLYVRRAALMAYLERLETPAPTPIPTLPPADPRLVELLRRPPVPRGGRV